MNQLTQQELEAIKEELDDLAIVAEYMLSIDKREDRTMSNVTFPPRETVNGLRIAGWMLHDTERDELFPAYYCGESCARQGGYAGHTYEAHPQYDHEMTGNEFCDVCLESLS